MTVLIECIYCIFAYLDSIQNSILDPLQNSLFHTQVMEEKKDEWHEVEEEVTCSICKEIFTEPKTITCLHTFCEACIKLMIESNKRLGSKNWCPLCRTEFTEDATKIPVNFSTKRLIEIFRKRRETLQKTSREIFCSECDSCTPAVIWCVECENFQCGQCLKLHEKMKVLKSHDMMTIEQFIKNPKKVLAATHKSEYCKVHDAQPLDLYCITCSSLICRDCTIVDHHQHQYNFVNILADQKRVKIKMVAALLKTMLEQVRTAMKKVEDSDHKIKEKSMANITQVQCVYQCLHETLEQQEAKDLQNTNANTKTLSSSLHDQKQHLKHLEQSLISCDEFVSKVTSKERASQLLIHCNDIQKRVNDLTNQVKQSSLKPVCEVDHLVLSTSNPNNYVSHFTSLCRVSTLPHLPNCTVKSPPAMSKYGPVTVNIKLKDKDGHPVPNQTEHLTIHFEDMYIAGYVKREERRDKNDYQLSYKPKRREEHNLTILWKENVLKKIIIPVALRDYTAIQHEASTISTYGPNTEELRYPHLLAVGPDDEIIVRDLIGGRLVVFDDKFNYSHSIGEGLCASGIAVSNRGILYVANYDLNVIQKFKLAGEFISELGSYGSGDGEYKSPHGLLLLQSDELLFVCDRNNHRIQVLHDEQFFHSFGQHGEKPGCFNFPVDIAANSSGNQLLVTDDRNNRVQLFTLSGQFLKVFGEFAQIPYNLIRPTGIYCAADGHVLVCSHDTNRVLIFDEDGSFVSAITHTYKEKKRFESPFGIVMKQDGSIIVAGNNSNNLVIF